MKSKVFSAAKLMAMIFLTVSILFPLISVILTIQPSDLIQIIKEPQFTQMMWNSLLVTVSATICSVTLALILAWCLNRSAIGHKRLFAMLFTVPMLIPSISHGVGLILLLGENGIISNMLHLKLQLYGYPGLIIGSVLYSFPPAFLLLMDIFQYEDYSVYEAAKVLGIGKFNQLLIITLPNIRKTLISAVFATFTLIFTDYGVPLAVGGKIMTLPLYMYREVIGLLDFSKGAIIGVFLLIPAFLAFLVDVKGHEVSNASTVTKEFEVTKNTKRDLFAYIVCISMVFFISLPIIAFLYLSFVRQYPIDMSFSLQNIREALQLGVVRYLENSLAIALSTSFLGVACAFFIAFLTTRTGKSVTNMALHLVSMISLAIPGVVLGLSYILFFKGSFIYGTLVILILVNTVHFFASPYLLAYNSLSKFNENMEDVSETLGISRFHMIRDIYIPCTQGTILEMFGYFFVNCMITISAVSFLANFKNMPIALMIPMFESQTLLESTAFISILILTVNCLMKAGVAYMKKRYCE